MNCEIRDEGEAAVIASAVPPDGKLLVVVNGAYGDRMARIASVMKIDTTVLRCPEDAPPTDEDGEPQEEVECDVIVSGATLSRFFALHVIVHRYR